MDCTKVSVAFRVQWETAERGVAWSDSDAYKRQFRRVVKRFQPWGELKRAFSQSERRGSAKWQREIFKKCQNASRGLNTVYRMCDTKRQHTLEVTREEIARQSYELGAEMTDRPQRCWTYTPEIEERST